MRGQRAFANISASKKQKNTTGDNALVVYGCYNLLVIIARALTANPANFDNIQCILLQ